jgi:hypothetical protein
MSFAVVPEGERFRVSRHGALLSARFHRREQAEAYVATQEKTVRDEHNARNGHLQAGAAPNVYDPALNLLNYPAKENQ